MSSKLEEVRHKIRVTKENIICKTTYISPKLNTCIRYKMVNGVYPDLKNPKTFCEKICWLKLHRYMKDPLVIQCADKYRVREYIQKKGCGALLNELYHVYESPDQIEWDFLPRQFVMKWNFGAGKNLICKDKSQYDPELVINQFRIWEKDKCWLPYSELQYKYIPHKIICEKFLQDDQFSNDLPDYKVYCFNGEPLAILVIEGRYSEIKAEFYDCNWLPLESVKYKKPEKHMKKPKCLEQMLSSARILSAPFPFVRVDFYIVNERLYFGELTFTPAGGIRMAQTMIQGKDMTEYLVLA